MRRDPQVERAQPAVDEEAVEWAGHRSDRVLNEADALVEPLVPDHHQPADHVGVAAEVLRGRVDDRVRPELERTLHDRCRERVIHGDDRVLLAGHDVPDVDDVQQRVRGRLDPDQPGLRPHRALERAQIGLINHVVVDPEALQDLVHQPVRAAVEVAREDHVVAGTRMRRDERVRGRHPAREGGPEPALQLADRVLKRGPRRVGGARVVVILDELARSRLHVGRGLVDRWDHRAEAGVGLEPRVDHARREPGLARGRGRVRAGAIVSGHRASDSSRSARVTIPAARPSMFTSSASRRSASSSTASRTLSSAATAGKGASITSTIWADSTAGSSIAWRSSPRSVTDPTTVCGSCADTTGSCETLCSWSSVTASRTWAWVSTVSRGGISPSACFWRSTSATVSSASRSRKPYWRIHASLKTFERYERPPSGRITATIADGSSSSRATW